MTKINYVRVFGAERLPPANEAGAGQADTLTHSRGPGTPGHNTPVTPVGAPGNRTPSTHASGQPGVNDRTSDQASHVGR